MSNLDLIIGCHEGELNGVCAPISSNLAKDESLVLSRNMSGFEELTQVDLCMSANPVTSKMQDWLTARRSAVLLRRNGQVARW